MEKYGCNRLDEINRRIKELQSTNFKTAEESSELRDLQEAKQEMAEEMSEKTEF